MSEGCTVSYRQDSNQYHGSQSHVKGCWVDLLQCHQCNVMKLGIHVIMAPRSYILVSNMSPTEASGKLTVSDMYNHIFAVSLIKKERGGKAEPVCSCASWQAWWNKRPSEDIL